MAVRINTAEFRERVRKAVMRGVIRGTEAVRNEAVSLILNTAKTGRVYQRRGIEHVASAPGEPPASNTGRLVNSIETKYDAQALTGEVNTSVEYGMLLEYGTQKMEPRPFLRPAIANKRQDIETMIAEEIKKEFG